jgi:hypothetical protein
MCRRDAIQFWANSAKAGPMLMAALEPLRCLQGAVRLPREKWAAAEVGPRENWVGFDDRPSTFACGSGSPRTDVLDLEFLHIQGRSVRSFNKRSSFWMLCFGFVSGHDFSRAVKDGKRIGLQPLLWRILHEMLIWRQAKKKRRG